MGNTNKSYIDVDGCLKLDRILDAENKIYIGIGSSIKNKSLQAIRFGDYTQKYHRLVNFTEKENKLKYEFENDIIMVLEKNEDDILLDVSSIKNNLMIIKKQMDPAIRKYHKKISLDSYELDKIYDFIHKEI
jgi:hypothetical protein